MPLRDYQQEAVDKTFTYCRDNKSENALIVAPTGAGKSHIIAGIIEQTLNKWKDVGFLVVAHRKELINQNAAKVAPHIDTGIFCSGLGRKQVAQVTFATIGSIHSKADLFPHVKVLIVDEAHMIPTKEAGRFRKLINDLKTLNNVTVIGLTATPYRTESGILYGDSEEHLFKEVCFDCDLEKLQEQGYLSQIVGKEVINKVDTSKLKVRMGEYIGKEMEDLFMPMVRSQCVEIVSYAEGRKKWLIFCAGVLHSRKTAEVLRELGIKAESLTGDNSKGDREEVLAKFERGEIQALTNCDILTTGFDAPGIDLIALLRPTQSVGLYVQMVGRGLRKADGKEDCLCLDFGENFERHGTINEVAIRGGKPREDITEPTTKTCEDTECRTINSYSASECFKCHSDFYRKCPHCKTRITWKIYAESDQCINCNKYLTVRNIGKATSDNYKQLGYEEIDSVSYSVHKKIGGNTPSLKITYTTTAGQVVNDFHFPEHEGFALVKTKKFLRKAIRPENLKSVPTTAQELVNQSDVLFKQVKAVKFIRNGKWKNVDQVVYKTAEEEAKNQESFFEAFGVNI